MGVGKGGGECALAVLPFDLCLRVDGVFDVCEALPSVVKIIYGVLVIFVRTDLHRTTCHPSYGGHHRICSCHSRLSTQHVSMRNLYIVRHLLTTSPNFASSTFVRILMMPFRVTVAISIVVLCQDEDRSHLTLVIEFMSGVSLSRKNNHLKTSLTYWSLISFSSAVSDVCAISKAVSMASFTMLAVLSGLISGRFLGEEYDDAPSLVQDASSSHERATPKMKLEAAKTLTRNFIVTKMLIKQTVILFSVDFAPISTDLYPQNAFVLSALLN